MDTNYSIKMSSPLSFTAAQDEHTIRTLFTDELACDKKATNFGNPKLRKPVPSYIEAMSAGADRALAAIKKMLNPKTILTNFVEGAEGMFKVFR